MPKQPAIPGLRDVMKKKLTRREQFLAEMDAVVPWGRLQALIEPHYPKAGLKGGRSPMPLDVNGVSNIPKTGRSKFPSLAGSVVSRFRDLQLRSLVGDRGALALAAV